LEEISSGDLELFTLLEMDIHIPVFKNMFVGGTFTTNQTDLNDRNTGSCGESSGCLDSTFNNAKACYTGYSNNIASVADNVVKTIEFSGLLVSCNDASATAYYVSLTNAEFTQFTYTTVANCNFQANWFINIRGTDNVEITGASFPAIPGGVVYNVVGCGREIYVHDTTLSGHFLAPCSNLNQPNGLITGKVVAGNVVASLQINRADTCVENVTVTIPVVVQVPSIQSSRVQFTGDSLRAGDNLSPGVDVTATFGNGVVSLSAPVTVSQGQVFFVAVNSVDGRTPANSEEPSSASVVSMAVASIVALIALAF